MHANLISENSLNYVKSILKIKPKVAIVLGSGIKALENLEQEQNISYSDIPDFPRSTVVGHAGVASFGYYEGVPISILRGRFHRYEGHEWKSVIAPVALMKELGITHLILTNAAGGVNRQFLPGDLMLIEDQICMHEMIEEERKVFYNVLGGKKYIDLYNPELRKMAKEVAVENKVKLQEGTYIALPGPTYETRAEILMMRNIGADATGMSTVHEALWARALGINIIGISCITNATYYEKAMSETSHEEVIIVAKRVAKDIDTLLKGLIKKI